MERLRSYHDLSSTIDSELGCSTTWFNTIGENLILCSEFTEFITLLKETLESNRAKLIQDRIAMVVLTKKVCQ